MARKILNRKELREENEAAEKAEAAPKAAVKKAPAKRKSRAKVAKEVRLKAFWGVFNQSLRRISLFEYSQRARGRQESLRNLPSRKKPRILSSL